MKTSTPLLKLILLVALFGSLLSENAIGQVPTWEWARQGICHNPPYGGEVSSITTDSFGNEYLVGFYEDTITFGNDTLIGDINSGNMFLAKYDSSGQFIWAKTAANFGA